MDDLQYAKVVLDVAVLLSAVMHSACLRNRLAVGLDEEYVVKIFEAANIVMIEPSQPSARFVAIPAGIILALAIKSPNAPPHLNSVFVAK